MRRRAVAHNARNFADNSVDHLREQTCNARPHEQASRDERVALRARTGEGLALPTFAAAEQREPRIVRHYSRSIAVVPFGHRPGVKEEPHADIGQRRSAAVR